MPKVSKYALLVYQNLRSRIFINNNSKKYKNVIQKQTEFDFENISSLFNLSKKNHHILKI